MPSYRQYLQTSVMLSCLRASRSSPTVVDSVETQLAIAVNSESPQLFSPATVSHSESNVFCYRYRRIVVTFVSIVSAAD